MNVHFGVRNCKLRGVIIESIQFNDCDDVYFFKYHNQSIDNHCLQVQNIMRRANVKRAKKIKVDISDFVHEYFNPAHGTVWFKGIKLESSTQQLIKTMTKQMNIDVGVKKRIFTNHDNKAAKAAEKRNNINLKAERVEKVFQEERAKRIHELVTERRDRARHMDCNN